MPRITLIVFLCLVVSGCVSASRGPITNEADAVAATASAMRRFASYDASGPYHARLKDGVWHVAGTLPPNTNGGTPEADIRASDGKILRVYHTQ